MPDTYSTDTLLGVVERLETTVPLLLQRYFPRIVEDTSEEIHFDVFDRKRRLAPFVAPQVPGKIVKNPGFNTRTFKPAYIKDKREFNPSGLMSRMPGEPLAGRLSPQEREDLMLAAALKDQKMMIDTRLEVMAVEFLRTGKETIAGDEYPTTVVDFGRDASLTGTPLAGTDRWDDPGSSPLADLRAASMLTLQLSGVAARDAIMGVDAAAAFTAHADVKERLDIRNLTGNTMNTEGVASEGLTPLGVIDGFRIFAFAGWYYDEDTDSNVDILPANEIIMASPGIEGIQAFGAIKDANNLTATKYYSKSWVDNDPGIRWLLMQSAPLIVPMRPNASYALQVLA